MLRCFEVLTSVPRDIRYWKLRADKLCAYSFIVICSFTTEIKTFEGRQG